MSKAQNSLSASDAEPAFLDLVSDPASRLMAGVGGEPCGESAKDDGADLAGRTLLSRAPAPEGRRSLFRR